MRGSKTTSESARAAANARWAKTSPSDRQAGASKAALARHAKAGHSTPEPVIEKPCTYCGTAMRGSHRKQCGAPECRKRYNADRTRPHMHERRAKLRGIDAERFNPAEVYERDGWTCGICSLPVDPALTWPDPLSVSLDHILPVSLGGPHTRENTRCSHLGCNSKRGNRIA